MRSGWDCCQRRHIGPNGLILSGFYHSVILWTIKGQIIMANSDNLYISGH